jgi:inner membrane protein
MPTVFTHPAVAIGAFPWFRRRLGHPALLLAGMALTVLPDIDVVGFRLGIAYGDLLGHRGLTHSLFFAVAVGALVAWPSARWTGAGFRAVWLYFSICLASHGLLDALTDGGLGIAFLSPFSNERFFFDFRPVRVSALSVERFFAGDWTGLLAIEFKWIWLPALVLGAAGMAIGLLRGVRRGRAGAAATSEHAERAGR